MLLKLEVKKHKILESPSFPLSLFPSFPLSLLKVLIFWKFSDIVFTYLFEFEKSIGILFQIKQMDGQTDRTAVLSVCSVFNDRSIDLTLF